MPPPSPSAPSLMEHLEKDTVRVFLTNTSQGSLYQPIQQRKDITGDDKRFTRIASLLLAASIAAPMLIGNMTAYAVNTDDTPAQVSSFQWKYPKNPSFEEINQYAADHPFDVALPDSYDIIPDIANEEINTRIGTDTSALVDAKGKADRDKLAGSLTQETCRFADALHPYQ